MHLQEDYSAFCWTFRRAHFPETNADSSLPRGASEDRQYYVVCCDISKRLAGSACFFSCRFEMQRTRPMDRMGLPSSI